MKKQAKKPAETQAVRRTSVTIPEKVYIAAKASAATRGVALHVVVTDALRSHLGLLR
jgi:hypothetical protein